jgi:cbb3-type cytochrome oxidase subunit 3
MSRIKTFSFLLSAVLLALFFLPINFASADTTPAPILVNAVEVGQDSPLPLITGLSWPNTEITIYLNGNQVGDATVNQTDTKTDNFYWKAKEPLSVGIYQVTAIARDKISLSPSVMSNSLELEIAAPPVPTLIAPNEQTITSNVRPLIIGLTGDATQVHIWIDGVKNGKTEILTHPSGTANFAYQPFLNLETGEHAARAVAEDKWGRQSIQSPELKFRIEEPLPAPVLLPAVVNDKSSNERPFIVGLAKNNYRIRVFIDKKCDGEFKVDNHPSGTANFAYQPSKGLTSGDHLIYLTAMDERGKESPWSNLGSIKVLGEARISDTAVEEQAETTVKGSESEFIPPPEKGVEVIETESGEAIVEPKVPPGTDVSEFISTSAEDEIPESGLLNESQERQGKLRFNLVIFILFLLAVIVWIFWVNRELIKERREQEDNKDKNQDKLEF